MKVLQINTVYPKGSTGKICKGIADSCAIENIESYIAYAYGNKNNNGSEIYVSSWIDNHIHNRLARITMLTGCFSLFHTLRFLQKVKKIDPDIIHLHNLHANYINLFLLFHYIKATDTPVVWTLHDCWAYTGYCTYYDIVGCDKWQTQCINCPSYRMDPVNRMDNSHKMYRFKKRLFSGVDKMVLVTPSKWLNGELKKSFLNNYPTSIINNGIDLSVFKPSKSDFRKRFNIKKEKKILLGVAFGWGERKGLDVFIELSRRLSSDYQIVLVGTDSSVDKLLPKNIISIHRTHDQKELAMIYSAADLFVNPTREEMFGLVNIESLACGTPVVTFDSGGSPECIDETCGCVVPKNDIKLLEKEIVRICETNPYSKDACVERAKLFDANMNFKKYIDLYTEVNNDRIAKD